MFLRRQLLFNLVASHLLSVTLGGGLADLETRVCFKKTPGDTKDNFRTAPRREGNAEKFMLF